MQNIYLYITEVWWLNISHFKVRQLFSKWPWDDHVIDCSITLRLTPECPKVKQPPTNNALGTTFKVIEKYLGHSFHKSSVSCWEYHYLTYVLLLVRSSLPTAQWLLHDWTIYSTTPTMWHLLPGSHIHKYTLQVSVSGYRYTEMRAMI